MDQELLREITVGSVRLALMCSLPLLGAGMLVGFIVAILFLVVFFDEFLLDSLQFWFWEVR